MMIDREKQIVDEVPKHKKKSKKKGQPRADHKHEYKTVLLLNEYVNRYWPDKTTLYELPKKVCTICGRVGDTDMSMYDLVEIEDPLPYKIHKRVIRDKESLEKWYVDDYFDKFAKKMDGEEHE